MNTRDYGCNNMWCKTYRAGLAHRADVAEQAMRALETQVLRLRIQLDQATRPPEPPAPRDLPFRLSRWVLLGLILIVLGGGLLTTVLIAEDVMTRTTFYEGP